MTSIVNGYVCKSSCDIDAARKGRDPRHPNDDLVAAGARTAPEGRIADGFEGRDGTQVQSVASDSEVADHPGRPPDGLGEIVDRFV